MFRGSSNSPTEQQNEAIQKVTFLLERAIGWHVITDDFSGKLSSVLFITESFLRHMEKLFMLEERDGYMNVVCKLRPEFIHRVNEYKQVHVQLLETVRQMVICLENTLPNELDIFEGYCENLQNLIGWFKEHNLLENELLIEALCRDNGGQG